MISVAEARELIRKHCIPLVPKKIPLRDVHGKIAEEDIYSKTNVPGFAQSSMDGYAFVYQDYLDKKQIKVTLESAAGRSGHLIINGGEAARIFTGAALPEGTDTVVMQEKASIQDGYLFIGDENIKSGSNVRPTGAEIKKNELMIPQGTLMSPPVIGFLAAAGCDSLLVCPNPSVAVILTGNEIRLPGSQLDFGEIYDSNSFMLRAALQIAGIEEIETFYAKDSLAEVGDVLNEALTKFDIVLLSGGVSVGDYDFVVEAARRCEVTQVFHKIKQRPGKPLYFGKKGQQLIFGLPGNPSSVLSCFYQYVLPALQLLQHKTGGLKVQTAALDENFTKPAGLTHFLKGSYNDGSVEVLNAQESFRLFSFAKANCLIEIEEEKTSLSKGSMVTIHMLPGYL